MLLQNAIKVTQRVEKSARHFLWSGVVEQRRDRFVSQDSGSFVVSLRMKGDQGLVIWCLNMKILLWQLNNFGALLWRLILCSTNYISAYSSLERVGCHPSKQYYSHQSLEDYFPGIYSFWTFGFFPFGGDGILIKFWEEIEIGNSVFPEVFPNMLPLSTLQSLPISHFQSKTKIILQIGTFYLDI